MAYMGLSDGKECGHGETMTTRKNNEISTENAHLIGLRLISLT